MSLSFYSFSSRSLSLLCCRSRKTAVTLYSVVPFLLLYLPEQLSYLCKSLKTLSVFLSLIFFRSLSRSLSQTNTVFLHMDFKERGAVQNLLKDTHFLRWFRCSFSWYVKLRHGNVMFRCYCCTFEYCVKVAYVKHF